MSYSFAFAADDSGAYGLTVRADGTRFFDDVSRAIIVDAMTGVSVNPASLESLAGGLRVEVLWQPGVPSARDLAVGAALLGYTVLAMDTFGAPGTDHLVLAVDDGSLPKLTQPAEYEGELIGYAVVFDPELARRMFPGGTGIMMPTWLPPAPAPAVTPQPAPPSPVAPTAQAPPVKAVEAGLFGLGKNGAIYIGAAALGLFVCSPS